MNWSSPSIKALIPAALDEDAARRDITTRTLIPASLNIEAQIQAKQAGIVCGLPFAAAFFISMDPKARFYAHMAEGRRVKAGAVLARVRGKARAILSAERTALNAIQHLSGIATYTARQVERLNDHRTMIYDTRKTLPGWRVLQKYAVRCGGGKNHRMNLQDAFLVKDNHLRICRLIGVDWKHLIPRFKKYRRSLPLEIEVQSSRDLKAALALRPDQVLLDNMPADRLRRYLKQLRRKLPKVEIEVSGGVESEQLRTLARLGVDRISMGRLTHSAPAFDCSLEITRVLNAR